MRNLDDFHFVAKKMANFTFNLRKTTYGALQSINPIKINTMKSVFDTADVAELIARIQTLTPQTPAKWGKMQVAQMLAHCCVSYEMIFEPAKHPKPNFILGFILRTFVKKLVVNDQPFKQNERTAPAFVIADSKNFEEEKARLIAYLQQTLQLGAAYFDNKESHSFGPLTKTEWNNMLYKHLAHHLAQFGV